MVYPVGAVGVPVSSCTGNRVSPKGSMWFQNNDLRLREVPYRESSQRVQNQRDFQSPFECLCFDYEVSLASSHEGSPAMRPRTRAHLSSRGRSKTGSCSLPFLSQ
jgi:hypothetical protein